jgi:hypothetical protein
MRDAGMKFSFTARFLEDLRFRAQKLSDLYVT